MLSHQFGYFIHVHDLDSERVHEGEQRRVGRQKVQVEFSKFAVVEFKSENTHIYYGIIELFFKEKKSGIQVPILLVE